MLFYEKDNKDNCLDFDIVVIVNGNNSFFNNSSNLLDKIEKDDSNIEIINKFKSCWYLFI